MVDMSFIGKNGIIVQYEDAISLWGYNVLLQLKSMKLVQRMSDEDILLDYFNRDIEDPFEYIKTKYHLDFPIDSMYKSQKALRPNLLYAFKLFNAAYQNGVKDLYVYSNKYSDVIKLYIQNEIPDIPINYVHGDILPVIRRHPNCTFLTSSTSVVKRIYDNKVPPFALTIIDTFMYAAPIVNEEFVNSLRNKGVFVGFTGILSAGLIP